MNYVAATGVELASVYPFVGKVGECKFDKKKAVFRNQGSKMVPK